MIFYDYVWVFIDWLAPTLNDIKWLKKKLENVANIGLSFTLCLCMFTSIGAYTHTWMFIHTSTLHYNFIVEWILNPLLCYRLNWVNVPSYFVHIVKIVSCQILVNEYPLNSNTSYYTIDRNDRIYVLPVAYKIYKMNKLFEKLLKIFKL